MATIEELSDQWGRVGRPWFDQFRAYPESFEALIRTTDTSLLHPNHAFTYAKIARHLGIPERAGVILDEAIPRVPETATILSAEMRSFLDDVRAEK